MAKKTRLSSSGHDTRRNSSFAGKTPGAGGGSHPVHRITRLGSGGYGTRRCGSFAGKAAGAGSGAHPVGRITRLGSGGYGTRRCGSFAGKATSVIVIPPIVVAVGGRPGKRPVQSTGSRVDDQRDLQDILNIVLASGILNE